MDDEDLARRATNTWERRSACKAGARLTCLLKHYEQCHGIRDSDRDRSLTTSACLIVRVKVEVSYSIFLSLSLIYFKEAT